MTGVDAPRMGTQPARDRGVDRGHRNTGSSISNQALLALVAEITIAYTTRNHPAIIELPLIISSVFDALNSPSARPPASLKPAVPIRGSVRPDYIVCLEDGKKLKLLKGHLRSSFGMTPDQYRAKWGLGADYPMVAPNYSSTRSKLALACGLGKRRDRGVAKPALGAAA
jgi:predicted transcriptional regulator